MAGSDIVVGSKFGLLTVQSPDTSRKPRVAHSMWLD